MSVKVRRRKLPSGKLSLYLDVYHKGKRSYEFLNLYLNKNTEENKEILRIASTIASKRQIELNSNRYGVVPQHKGKLNFIEYFKQMAEGKPSKDPFTNTYKKLCSYTGGHLQFTDIDKEWLKGFRKYLESELKTNTVYIYYSRIKQALNQAVREGIIHKSPAKDLSSPAPEKVKREFLTTEELRALVNTRCGNEEVKRAFLFSCYTGLRLSDVLNLTWANIKDNQIEFVQQKTQEPQYQPIPKPARQFLYFKTDGTKLLPVPTNKVFSLPHKRNMPRTVKNWARRAGIHKDINYHTSRHTYAVWLLEQDINIYTVSKLLGHTTVKTTEIYAKIADKKKVEAVEKLPNIMQ